MRRNEEVGLLDSWIGVVDGCMCVLYGGLETMMEVNVSCWRIASSKAQTDRGESGDSLRDTGLIDSCCTVEQSMHCRARLRD